MATAKTPEQIGKDKLSAAADEATLTDDEKNAKARASRFIWQAGDITITNPDGTVVMKTGEK